MDGDEKKPVRLDVEVVVESIVDRVAQTAPSLRRRRRRRGVRFGALWGYFERDWAERMDHDLDRVLAMLWRMRQRCE